MFLAYSGWINPCAAHRNGIEHKGIWETYIKYKHTYFRYIYIEYSQSNCLFALFGQVMRTWLVFGSSCLTSDDNIRQRQQQQQQQEQEQQQQQISAPDSPCMYTRVFMFTQCLSLYFFLNFSNIFQAILDGHSTSLMDLWQKMVCHSSNSVVLKNLEAQTSEAWFLDIFCTKLMLILLENCGNAWFYWHCWC